MKKCSKVIQAVVIVLMVLSIAAAAAAAVYFKKPEKEKPDFTVMVISDIHVFSEAQVGEFESEAYKAFDAFRSGKMVHLSECIFKSAADKIIDSKPDALFVSGDMSDYHAIDTHYVIAEQFRRIEAAGIDVYVTAGNHDTDSDPSYAYTDGVETEIPGTTSADMRVIYNDFGYGDADVKDTETMSYVSHLNDQYSLVSIDAYDSNGNDEATRRLIAWTETQTAALTEQGRVPLGLVHFPALGHYGKFVDNFLSGTSKLVHLDNGYRDAMIRAGMKYVFTGHMHSNDISSYTNNAGTLYDIETAALANTPCPIRTVECYGDRMVITTQKLEKINPDYLPLYLPAEDRTKILTDFQSYAREYCSLDMAQFFFESLFPGAVPAVLDMFGLRWSNAGTRALYTDIMELLNHFAYLPIYIKEERAGGTSLQRICAQYNITLPASDYKNVLDLMLYGVAAANFRGDENISKASTEGVLVRYTFYAAFYLLADFDVFGRLNAVNPEIAAIDLMPAMPDLFTKGELDLVENNLIGGIVGSISLIKENELLGGLVGLTSQEWVGALAALSELEILGLKPLKYISAENGTLLVGAFLDEILFGKAGKGVLIDDNPPDNNIVFDFATGAWYTQS